MKLRYLFLLFIFSTTFLFGQSNSPLNYGEMVKQTMKESWATVKPIGSDDNGVFYLLVPYSAVMSGLVVGNHDYFIGYVGHNGNLESIKPLQLLVDGEVAEYEFAEEIGDKILLFTTLHNKKLKTVSFYTFELNKKSITAEKPKKIIDLEFEEFKREFERASFKAELSRDKSKMLISYSLLNDESSILAFGYLVLNNQQIVESKWIGNLNMTDGIYQFDQFRISNKGAVSLLTRFYGNDKAFDENTKMKKSNLLSTTRSMQIKDNYEHRVVKFLAEGKTKIFRVANTDKFYVSLDLEYMPNDDIILIGFSSDNETTLPNSAVCLLMSASTGSIKETGLKPFGDQFSMPSNLSIKNNGLVAGEEQYINYRFVLSDIKFNSNGGYTLIGERNVLQTKKSNGSNYTVNHLDDLAVIDVDPKGQINNVFKIEKSQQVSGLDFFKSSYFYFTREDIKYFVFSNVGKSKIMESKIVTIDLDGKVSSEVLIKRGDADVVIAPKGGYFSKNRVYLYGMKNNRYSRWITKEF
jgi:hypothetical protein